MTSCPSSEQASSVDFPDRAANEPYVFIEGQAQEVRCDVTDVVPVPAVRFYVDDVDFSSGLSVTATRSVRLLLITTY